MLAGLNSSRVTPLIHPEDLLELGAESVLYLTSQCGQLGPEQLGAPARFAHWAALGPDAAGRQGAELAASTR
jgi:hypothetical protein